MKKTRRYTKVGYTVILAMVMSHGPLALAGWTGIMNGTGYGLASVNVVSGKSGEKSTASVAMQNPGAAIVVTPGYFAGADLPEDASPATVAKVLGSPGYIWQAETVGSNGDSTDNPEPEFITITAADCASLTVQTVATVDKSAKTGTIHVQCKGTEGTGLLERGYELTDPNFQTPPTTRDEFIQYLKDHGTERWHEFKPGPFNHDIDGCTTFKIEFSFTTFITNLYSVSDGVAKSLPLVIQCPTNIVVGCAESVKYPQTVIVGGCGNITVSFNPPAVNPDGSFPAGYFPVGTNLVTVTATDKDSNTTSCTFNVIVRPVFSFTGFYPPIGTVSNSCTAPSVVVVNRGSVAPLKWDFFCGTTRITTGTPPTVTIQPVSTSAGDDCKTNGTPTTVAAVYQNDWHYNWDTTGWPKATYKVTANLPDGITKPYVYIKIK